MVLIDRSLKLVTAERAVVQGLQSPETPMTQVVKAVVMLGGQLGVFRKHRVQVRALGSDQLLWVAVVAETCPADDPTAPATSASRTVSPGWAGDSPCCPVPRRHTLLLRSCPCLPRNMNSACKQ